MGKERKIKQAGLKVQPAVENPMLIQFCCVNSIFEETTVFYNRINRFGICIPYPRMIRELVKKMWNYYNNGYENS